MPDSKEDYRQLVDKPWGRMFYDMVFRQLGLSADVPLRILDFGAGFCISANHYARHHKVVAVEPDGKMRELCVRELPFELINGDIETLGRYDEGTFDVVLCHNVLEYTPDRKRIVYGLARLLKQGGIFSVVKHNLAGRILASAVFSDNPEAALELLESGDRENNMFGQRNTYEDDYIITMGQECGLEWKKVFGIRTFFALSQNNEVKFTQEWYDKMLELEMKTCDVDEYKNISFFHHLIFQKKG